MSSHQAAESLAVRQARYEPLTHLPPKCSWEDEGDDLPAMPEWRPLSPPPMPAPPTIPAFGIWRGEEASIPQLDGNEDDFPFRLLDASDLEWIDGSDDVSLLQLSEILSVMSEKADEEEAQAAARLNAGLELQEPTTSSRTLPPPDDDDNDSLSSLSDAEPTHVACQHCGKVCSSLHYLRQHIRFGRCGKTSVVAQDPVTPSSSRFTCPSCRKAFSTQFILDSHLLTHTQSHEQYSDGTYTLQLSKYSLERLVREYKLTSTQPIHDIDSFFWSSFDLLRQMHATLQSFLIKALLYLRVQYIKVNQATGQVIETVVIHFPSKAADDMTHLETWLQRHLACLLQQIEAFHQRDSGLEFDKVLDADIKVLLAENRAGRGHFTLPPALKSKKAVVNVDTETDCFKYAVLSMLHYQDVHSNRQRVSQYRDWKDELSFEGIDNAESMSFKDIAKFEALNNIKIIIHLWEKGALQGVRYNKTSSQYERVINLLLVYQESSAHWHYCGIPSLKRLYRHTKGYCDTFQVCNRCVRMFKSKHAYARHYDMCLRNKIQMEELPRDLHFEYKELGYELSPVLVMYADIECYIDPHTKAHIPAAIGCREVWHSHFCQSLNATKLFQGKDCISQFLMYLDKKARFLQRRNNDLVRQPMSYTAEDQQQFESATHCPKCRLAFSESVKKVRDHCHITGKFRAALCHTCNASLRLKRRFLPVYFHNLKSYDNHMLLTHGMDKMKVWKLEVIAQTKEKYMTLSAKIPVDKTKTDKTVNFTIKFLDTFQFMASSLANLVNNLETMSHTHSLKRRYKQVSDDVLRRKGVFPYTYFTSLETMQETVLPPIEAFKNDLTGEDCSVDDYQHAQRAWQEFECRSFGDYMLAYLRLDIHLLADVFETFRGQCLREDQLDPVHFVSLPHMTFQSAFKMTREKVDLLHDIEMYTLFERGIRGGLTFVNKHHIQYSETEFDKTFPIYIDQNNLYGSALSKPLPHSNFKWVDEAGIQHFSNPQNILNIEDEGETGYLFCFDFVYPDAIKEATQDFPLAPMSDKVTEAMFTPFMKAYYERLKDQHQPSFKPGYKLLLTQYDRQNYVAHFAILKFYLSMGLQIAKIHSIIQFTQKPFLKSYIDYNTQKRMQARNAFEKDYYKLKNNALFGKTMEDVRKRMNYKLITDVDQTDKLFHSPRYYSHDVITPDLTGFKMFKSKVTLCKPVYIGQAVLDHSKLEMYKLFYQTLKPCPMFKQVELVGGDTDSFQLAITVDKSHTLTDIFSQLQSKFDSSNYPTDHPLYSLANKAKLGCFKDECAGQPIQEMVLLRPKMYSIKLRDTEIKRAKGISKSIVQKMKHQLYKSTYRHKKLTRVDMTILRSQCHRVTTTTFSKRALSAWEDKRCWLSRNRSLPHGHPDTGIAPPPKRPRLDLPPSGDVTA